MHGSRRRVDQCEPRRQLCEDINAKHSAYMFHYIAIHFFPFVTTSIRSLSKDTGVLKRQRAL